MTANSIAQLLRELEWSGRASGYAESFAVCPVCKGVKPGQPHAHVYFMDGAIGHKEGCRLESAAASLEAQEPTTYVAVNRKGAHCGFSRDGKDLEFRFRGIDTVSIVPLYRHPPTSTDLEAQEPVAHLGGVSMHQEDLNEMMRLPGERVAQQKIQVPTCPRCGERYCGDGVLPCLECKATEKQE